MSSGSGLGEVPAPAPPGPRPPARFAEAPRGPPGRAFRVSKIGKIGKFANFCKIKFLQKFWRARSRLYQNKILQENMRLTAFFKLYKICILLHRCNLKILTKNRSEKSEIFVKIQQFFATVAKSAKFCQSSKMSAT